ncbi:MAG: hypothetical protein V9G19_27815 [Tetrasphaera sp.]
MRLKSVFARALLALTGLSATAYGQEAGCNDCASCTAALAAENARVTLGGDLTHTGDGACVTIAGEGAQLNGLGRTLRGRAGIGVRVTGRGATVRNLTVDGLSMGVEVAADRVTVFHVTASARDVGFAVVGADAHLARVTARGAHTGIAFGVVDHGRCSAGATLRSPGAVVRQSAVERADVGIASCEAWALLSDNTVTDSEVGILLGAPAAAPGAQGPSAAGPWDDCACAPTLDHVRPTTTLMFSSGCGGCVVHEGWLPALRASHHDIRARETGVANLAVAQRFDAFLDRCLPELTDVLGIPGCVPNYGCLASGLVAKVRTGPNAFALETSVNGQEEVARLAEACATEGGRRYRAGASCARFQLVNNRVCGSRSAGLRGDAAGLKLPGYGNACGSTDGIDRERAGCTASCVAGADAGGGAAAVAPAGQRADRGDADARTDAHDARGDDARTDDACTDDACTARQRGDVGDRGRADGDAGGRRVGRTHEEVKRPERRRRGARSGHTGPPVVAARRHCERPAHVRPPRLDGDEAPRAGNAAS